MHKTNVLLTIIECFPQLVEWFYGVACHFLPATLLPFTKRKYEVKRQP